MQIQRGSIQIDSVEMYCQYCIHWITAKSTGYIDSDEDEGRKCRKSEGTRNCLKTKKEIDLKTKSCIHFKLCDNFWCDKNDHWNAIRACVSKQNKKIGDCNKCKQGKLIMKIYLYEED